MELVAKATVQKVVPVTVSKYITQTTTVSHVQRHTETETTPCSHTDDTTELGPTALELRKQQRHTRIAIDAGQSSKS